MLATSQPSYHEVRGQKRHLARIKAFSDMKEELVALIDSTVKREIQGVVAALAPSPPASGTQFVGVPSEVAGVVPTVAADLAMQQAISSAYRVPFHNSGTAYAQVRKHISPAVANTIRCVHRDSNQFKHEPLDVQAPVVSQPLQALEALKVELGRWPLPELPVPDAKKPDDWDDMESADVGNDLGSDPGSGAVANASTDASADFGTDPAAASSSKQRQAAASSSKQAAPAASEAPVATAAAAASPTAPAAPEAPAAAAVPPPAPPPAPAAAGAADASADAINGLCNDPGSDAVAVEWDLEAMVERVWARHFGASSRRASSPT